VRLTRVTNVQPRLGGGRGCRLRVIDGPDAGAEFSIPPVGAVIGADAAADITLGDQTISGRHCSVAPTEAGFKVVDLDSRNGTFIDGVAIGTADVPIGAVLKLGRLLVHLMPAEEAADIPPSESSSFGAMVGHSLAMRQVYAVLERASRTNASVLITGESGTGKELAARAVHDNSPRAGGPFVVFDCGAASETLIASDLFGHVRGAFTGANADRTGAFAAADGGTLFLDEIGDLPLALQPKLLRMLEAGEVTPLGGQQRHKYDVRIVAATHRDLWEDVGVGAFRGDLYYRLAVVEAHLPALRQRKEDISELVRLFLGDPSAQVEGANLEKLVAYHWPGNVRELRNIVTRAQALAAADATFNEMPILFRAAAARSADGANVSADRPFHDAKAELVEKFERAYLADLLARSGGNMSQAARTAGLERKYLYRILDRYGMRPRKD
jgi:DNA-binding NtrC family response regulator